jgi:hypothetical protein
MGMEIIPTFVVQSTKVWPSTGYQIRAGEKIVVMWISGQWSANPAWGILVNGLGNPQFPQAPTGYALPGAPEGALVGRVGSQAFLIGNRGVVPQNLSGTLYLAINDDVNGIYGAGYTDNIGSVKVMIFKEA